MTKLGGNLSLEGSEQDHWAEQRQQRYKTHESKHISVVSRTHLQKQSESTRSTTKEDLWKD